MLGLKWLPVGDYQANAYLVFDQGTQQGVLVDPGDQGKDLLAWIDLVTVTQILVTHGHSDHIGSLERVRQALGVPVGIHPADAARYGVQADFDLQDSDRIVVGAGALDVVHLPGHTPGSIGLKLVENGQVARVLVGDAIFPGGPGRTETPQDLATALDALARTVFTWPDETVLYPGHGELTTVGAERAAFEAFRAATLPPDLCGDITWR